MLEGRKRRAFLPNSYAAENNSESERTSRYVLREGKSRAAGRVASSYAKATEDTLLRTSGVDESLVRLAARSLRQAQGRQRWELALSCRWRGGLVGLRQASGFVPVNRNYVGLRKAGPSMNSGLALRRAQGWQGRAKARPAALVKPRPLPQAIACGFASPNGAGGPSLAPEGRVGPSARFWLRS